MRCDFGRGGKVRLRVGCVDGKGVPGRREGGMESNGEDGREVDVKVDDIGGDEAFDVVCDLDGSTGRGRSLSSVRLMGLT